MSTEDNSVDMSSAEPPASNNLGLPAVPSHPEEVGPTANKTSSRTAGTEPGFIDADGKYVREAVLNRRAADFDDVFIAEKPPWTFIYEKPSNQSPHTKYTEHELKESPMPAPVVKHVVHCKTHGYRLVNLHDLGVEMCENCRILDGSQRVPVPFAKMGNYKDAIGQPGLPSDYNDAIYKNITPVRSPIDFERWAEGYAESLIRHTAEADNPLGAAIAMVVGTASMCWTEVQRSGVREPLRAFDEQQANKLVLILQAWIEVSAKDGTILGEDTRSDRP